MDWRRSGAVLSAGGLFLGYLVAVLLTRSLGGVVLVAAGAAAFVAWWQSVGVRMAVRLGALYLILFVVSHILALLIGAWASVITVCVVMAAASWWFADSRREDAPARG